MPLLQQISADFKVRGLELTVDADVEELQGEQSFSYLRIYYRHPDNEVTSKHDRLYDLAYGCAIEVLNRELYYYNVDPKEYLGYDY